MANMLIVCVRIKFHAVYKAKTIQTIQSHSGDQARLGQSLAHRKQ